MISLAEYVAAHANGRELVGFDAKAKADTLLEVIVPELGARNPIYAGQACVWSADFGRTTHESYLSDATLARYGRRRSVAADPLDSF